MKAYVGKFKTCAKCGTILIDSNSHSSSKTEQQAYCVYCRHIYDIKIKPIRSSFEKRNELEFYKDTYVPFIWDKYPNPNIISIKDISISSCRRNCALFFRRDINKWVLTIETSLVEGEIDDPKDFFLVDSKVPGEKDYERRFVFGIDELKKAYSQKYFSYPLQKEVIDLYPENKFDDELKTILKRFE